MSADDLTESQRAAVEHYLGPQLVLAGPGSGKTRVITRRIARLVERGVSPRQILAITFTNKAAREMAERVERLLPGQRVWVTTFHKFCARMLRERAEVVGLRPNFSIFDVSDQHQLLRQILHDEDIDATHFPPNKIGWQISQAKNELISPDAYRAQFQERIGDHMQAVVARVYPKYQAKLQAANAVDFDDLLLHVAVLIDEHEDLRADLDRRFRFILVDEYQDTNHAQYRIVAQLSQREPNLCATGDPDQSIYGWRGAQLQNILRFERDYPQAAVFRLEDNFRSTPEILQAADALIANNRRRKPKTLRTENASGPPVELRLYADGLKEADGIAAEIRQLVEAGERRWSDFAIFYRINALSRSLETALSRLRVPYQVAAGVAFYERSEIKDLIAYLRLIENPRDRMAFLRIVNTPPRGIGKATLDRLMRWADETQQPLLEAAHQARQCPKLSARAVTALTQFAHLIEVLAAQSTGSVAELINEILSRTGYGKVDVDTAGSEEQLQRDANVKELITAAHQYDQQAQDGASLTGFLEAASLTQDVDGLENDLGTVTLMTLHAAKGLEFPAVYIIGVEQNLLPHERAVNHFDANELEEERRLLFVGITRAEHQLTLTHTLAREIRGRSYATIRSMFVDEFPSRDVDATGGTFATRAEWEQDEVVHRPALADRVRLPTALKLTTGAALASGQTTGVELPIGFSLGMQVRHPQYGIGTVVEITPGFSRRRTLTVEFADDGRRQQFVTDKCPLQPIGTE